SAPKGNRIRAIKCATLPPPPGIEAEPRWLTFTCVEPGCDTTLEATIDVVGPRAVAIKRIV
ncbi:unnamed protein product, partial [Discosporangium mesarthrocarpum]